MKQIMSQHQHKCFEDKRWKSNSDWCFLFSPSDTARSPVSPRTSPKVRLGTFEKGWNWLTLLNESRATVLMNGCFLFVFFFDTSDELHAEVCYAECLLQRAALTFLQVSQHFRTVTLQHVFTFAQCQSLPFLSLFRMKTWSVLSRGESKWGIATRRTSKMPEVHKSGARAHSVFCLFFLTVTSWFFLLQRASHSPPISSVHAGWQSRSLRGRR